MLYLSVAGVRRQQEKGAEEKDVGNGQVEEAIREESSLGDQE